MRLFLAAGSSICSIETKCIDFQPNYSTKAVLFYSSTMATSDVCTREIVTISSSSCMTVCTIYKFQILHLLQHLFFKDNDKQRNT